MSSRKEKRIFDKKTDDVSKKKLLVEVDVHEALFDNV
jgi:hypothetical protein